MSVASEVPGYSNSDLRRGNLPGLEQVVHIKAQAQRLRLDDTPGLSIQPLRAKCARLHTQQPLRLVLVDYFRPIRGDTKGNREQEVGSHSRSLKELNAPVTARSKLSRNVDKRGGEKRPLLSKPTRVRQPQAGRRLHRLPLARQGATSPWLWGFVRTKYKSSNYSSTKYDSKWSVRPPECLMLALMLK